MGGITAIPAGLRTDAFDYELPPERIAQHPAEPRDAARLLEVGETLADRTMRDFPDLLRPGDALVLNDTRVIPARLDGRRGAARIEVTLHKADADGRWRAFARPGKRLRTGDVIDFAPGFAATVAEKRDGGEIILGFDDAERLPAQLRRHGRMPLPPYIKRDTRDGVRDAADYQTVYARADGAVAAPTAGLHFTDALLAAISGRGVEVVTVTLHVGAGTFLPVKAERIAEHRMHAETGRIGADAAARINASRDAGGRIVACGTTSLRLMEAAAEASGRIAAFDGETDLFIAPGYRFRTADLLLTNFHLPRSTLFMLVAAFAGLERMKRAYAHAVRAGYRFYSYGDATLLHRVDPP